MSSNIVYYTGGSEPQNDDTLLGELTVALVGAFGGLLKIPGQTAVLNFFVSGAGATTAGAYAADVAIEMEYINESEVKINGQVELISDVIAGFATNAVTLGIIAGTGAVLGVTLAPSTVLAIGIVGGTAINYVYNRYADPITDSILDDLVGTTDVNLRITDESGNLLGGVIYEDGISNSAELNDAIKDLLIYGVNDGLITSSHIEAGFTVEKFEGDDSQIFQIVDASVMDDVIEFLGVSQSDFWGVGQNGNLFFDLGDDNVLILEHEDKIAMPMPGTIGRPTTYPPQYFSLEDIIGPDGASVIGAGEGSIRDHNNFVVGSGYLAGYGGNDVIFGGAENDDIWGGSGDDILFGQEGNDTFNTGSGSDEVYGGGDFDTYYLDHSDGLASISGLTGLDWKITQDGDLDQLDSIELIVAQSGYINSISLENNDSTIGYSDDVISISSSGVSETGFENFQYIHLGVKSSSISRSGELGVSILDTGGKSDSIDYSYLDSTSYGIHVVADGNAYRVYKWDGTSNVGTSYDTIYNIENIRGTSNSDFFELGHRTANFHGRGGDDVYSSPDTHPHLLFERSFFDLVKETSTGGEDSIYAEGHTPGNTYGIKFDDTWAYIWTDNGSSIYGDGFWYKYDQNIEGITYDLSVGVVSIDEYIDRNYQDDDESIPSDGTGGSGDGSGSGEDGEGSDIPEAYNPALPFVPEIQDPENSPIPGPIGDFLEPWDDAKNTSSPLVFDIDNDGIELASLTSTESVYWDIDEDGLAEASGWITGGDGLLAIDLNDDGIINDHSELFGSQSVDGFTVLSAYDSNADSFIDENDDQFDDLIMWVESNSNGFSELGELYSLAELGITSINLSASLVDYEIEGNQVTHESTFVINGQMQSVVDAWFSYDNMNSVYYGDYALDIRVVDLPTLRGFGDVKPLHVVMSEDDVLLDMVQEIVDVDQITLFSEAFDLHGKVTDILLRWGEASEIDPTSRGSHVDARVLTFLERYLGDDFIEQSGNPGQTATAIVENIFNNVVKMTISNLLIQSGQITFYETDAFYDFNSSLVLNSSAQFVNMVTSSFANGGEGSDAYYISQDSGNVIFHETGGNDIIWIDGYSVNDVRLEVSSNNYDLFVHYGDSTLTLDNQLRSSYSGTANYDDAIIESVRFSDGTYIDLTASLTLSGTDSGDTIRGTVNDDSLVGRDGNDSLVADGGHDLLVGGIGDDILQGGVGDDQYVWSMGDGDDVIYESGGMDQLVLLGIVESDLRFEKYSNHNLKIHIGSATITIDDQLRSDYSDASIYDYNQVETLLLDDGTTIDLTGSLTFTGTENGETISGLSQSDSVLYGLEGNDSLFGYNGDDILIGGLDNDTLQGGFGDDQYIWTVGDGDDLVYETGGMDQLVLHGVAESDLRFEKTSNYVDLEIHIGSATITLDNQLRSDYSDASIYDYNQVETLLLDDGTTIDLTGSLTFTGAEIGETIRGLSQSDSVLYGLEGDDNLFGYNGDDILFGGLDNDILQGGLGDDQYIWTVGDGDDLVYETGGVDQLVLHGVVESDLRFEKTSNYVDLEIHIGSATITLDNQLKSDYNETNSYDYDQVESLLLDDGTTIDLTGSLTFTGTEIGETIRGLRQSDSVLYGLEGDDNLFGYNGDDVLIGGLDNDTLQGGLGDDQYIWTVGDGDDYIVESGGFDTLNLRGVLSSEVSYTKFSNDLKIEVNAETITVLSFFNSENLKLENVFFDDGTVVNLAVMLNQAPIAQDDSFIGEQETVISGNVLSDNGAGVDSDPDGDILSVVSGSFNTTNGSVIVSSDGSFIYTPNTGFIGTDDFTYTLDDGLGGNDAGIVTVQIHNGSINQSAITGTAANENLYGDLDGISDDTIVGLGGNDYLYGAEGNDTYVWSVGDGNDTIYEASGIDQLVLHGVEESDIFFSKYSSYDLRINIGSEYIQIGSQLRSDIQGNSAYDIYQVESILLDDGTEIDITAGLTYNGTSSGETIYGTLQNSDTIYGNGGNDSLYAYGGDDYLNGGYGNDYLYGAEGSDTYVWSVGDGNDTIYEASGMDQLVLHGVEESDIFFSKYSSYDLRINIGSEYIQIGSQLRSDIQNNSAYDIYQVENILLDNGTVIDITGGLTYNGTSSGETIYGTYQNADILFGNGGNDSLYAYGGDDYLEGGLGNDYLYGAEGGDTYVWSVGDGNDTIYEASGIDQLVLHGVEESDIFFSKYSSYDLRINIGSEYIQIGSQLRSDIQGNSAYDIYQVESILLDDGTEIDITAGLTYNGTSSGETIYGTLQNSDTIYGNGGNDSLYAYGGDDYLEGGLGNDYLYGAEGNDTYEWSVGDGNDTIYETSGIDQLVLHGVVADDIFFSKYSSYDLRINIGSEYIQIGSQLRSDIQNNSAYDIYQVENILLDNGTVIDITGGLTYNGTSSGETIYGTYQNADILFGNGGNDSLYAYGGDDTLYGGGGSDNLYSGDGNDILYGGSGIDQLYGQSGADIFVFESDSAFLSIDNIQDFNLSDGDKLDVSDLLSGYDPITDAITDFIQITDNGSQSYLDVDADGGADNFVRVAYIHGQIGLTDEDALENSGNLIAA